MRFDGLLIRAAGLGLVLAVLASCVREPEKPKDFEPGRVLLPRIDTPAIKRGPAPDPDLAALPKGAQASFSNQDMDRIFVTLPPREARAVPVDRVIGEVIEPILKAKRFERGLKGLTIRADAGLEQQRPSLAGAARLLADEYEGNKEATRKRTQDMINAFLGKTPPSEEVDKALVLARGMTFTQFKADIERQEILYPFLQVDNNVPIEHTALIASRWEGQTVTSVRGVLIHNYTIANARPASSAGVVNQAYAALGKVKGIERVAGEKASDGPWLVLLPYGNDTAGSVSLRYAWRLIIDGFASGRQVPFLTWVDAQSTQILKMLPLVKDVSARGEVWRRDPGTGSTRIQFFEVDAASGGQYTLQLSGVANRVDHEDDGFDADDVSISSTTNGSSAMLANFNQTPINNEANAICDAGGNPSFQQVHYFGLFYSNWRQSLNHGIFTPFPTSTWSPRVESLTAGCNAWSDMDFGACQGYYDAACPNYSTGGTTGANYMNFAHDSTVVSHELAHNSVQRFTNTRPANWCGSPPCSIPLGWEQFHDLADAWATHVENTNCTGGWVAKNLGGADASKNCQGSRGHVEGAGAPRLHEVTWPFNPAAPGDHFPEHRDAATGEYAEMHMATAALWQVRQGMRSKCRPSGHPQFFVRWTRALKNTGFMGADPGSTDLGLYRYLHDLELEMIEQWATSGQPGGPPAFRHNGAHTTSKVLAGFAKTGLFPIPAVCIDGDATTIDATICPAGQNGADAVVDIEDNDLADDLLVDGTTHIEQDFLELGGPAPTFLVWTGSRFTFSGNNARPVTGNAPCNTQFNVEVSTSETFPTVGTESSGWTTVDIDTSTAASPECYGTWTPSAAQWTALQSGGALSRIYYRVRTRDAADGNERISTSPAAGLWTVPPPYAVLTTDGQSDY